MKLDLNNIKTIKSLALAFLGVVFIVNLLLFLPLIHSIDQARIRKEKDVATVNFLKNLISQKDKLTRVQIIPQDKIDDLLDEIQRIAQKNNIRPNIDTALQTDTQDKGTNAYVRKVFTMRASGPFKDLGMFLTALKDMPNAILDLKTIYLSGDQRDISNVTAQMTFSVLTTKNDENQ